MRLSLGWGPKITAQFTVVVLPLVALLLVQAVMDLQRSRKLASAFPLHLSANAARKDYKAFIDGVAEAVDSGTLSKRALEELH